jgi:hypothetical protein
VILEKSDAVFPTVSQKTEGAPLYRNRPMGMKYMFAMECSHPWVIAGPFFMVILQMLFTYVPQMNQKFHSAPIGLSASGKILFISLTIYRNIGIE